MQAWRLEEELGQICMLQENTHSRKEFQNSMIIQLTSITKSMVLMAPIKAMMLFIEVKILHQFLTIQKKSEFLI